MKLDDFIATSLLNIARGLNSAISQAESENLNLRVNPHFSDKHDDWDKYQRPVEFDVAVTTSETKVEEGSAGLKIYVLSVGGSRQGTAEATNVSRLKFSVPVLFPAHSTQSKQ